MYSRLTFSTLVRIILLNQLIIPGIELAVVSVQLALREQLAVVPDAIQILPGLEGFLEVRLIKGEELARMLLLRCACKRVAFPVERCSDRGFAVHEIWDLFVQRKARCFSHAPKGGAGW